MLRKLNRMLKGALRKFRIKIARLIWDNKDRGQIPDLNGNFIDKNNIESILFVRADGKIGDMVVSSFMFREIKKKYPNIKIGVIAKGGGKDIIEFSPYVDKIYSYEGNFSQIKNLAKNISEEKYDLLVEFYEEIKPQEIMFINQSKAKFNMGLNKKNWKLFDVSVDEETDFEWNNHISKRYLAYLKKIGLNIDNMDISYNIFFDEKRLTKIKEIREIHKERKLVVLNPFGASKHRNFTKETIEKILKELKGVPTLILYHGDKYDIVNEIAKNFSNMIVPEGIKSILDSAMYISLADFVVSPDTSIIHIADAFNKKIIGVYEYDGGILGSGHKVWGPKENRNSLLVFAPKRKSTYDDFDVNDFQMNEMREKIGMLINKG